MDGLIAVARIVLGMTFAIAAVAKVRRPRPLQDRLVALGSPRSAAGLVASAVVAVELGLGALLLFGIAPAVTGAVSAVVLVAFSSSIVARPTTAGCGCGLPGEGLAAWQLTARNASLAAVATVVTIYAQPTTLELLVASISVAVSLALAASSTSLSRLARRQSQYGKP